MKTSKLFGRSINPPATDITWKVIGVGSASWCWWQKHGDILRWSAALLLHHLRRRRLISALLNENMTSNNRVSSSTGPMQSISTTITTHWSRCSSAEYVGYYRSVCTQYFCACDTYTYKSCDSFLCTELFGFWDSNKLGIFGSEILPPNTPRNRCVMVGPLGLLLTGTGYGEHVSEFGLAVLIGDLLQSGHCSDSFLLLRFLLLGALQIKTQNN